MAKKNNTQLTLFNENVYEYFVLLSPSDTVKEAVDALKEQLHALIGLEDYNRKSVAHVSLFKTRATTDSQVLKLIKKVAAAQQPFTIKLAGHEVLKHGGASRTLCLKIEDPEPVNNLMALLDPKPIAKKSYRQTSILDKPQRAKKVIHPHVTIARTIATADFDRIEDFTPFDYHDEWLCDRITVLRRLEGTTGIFSPVKEVMLG
ncbi:2'-5' RNA ligase family protein [Flavobacterium sp. NRK1]|uniref:2'-5' RNA ligase family protein n=1 Tax=Flavobacterium sp. NRK1 TaxID=2954929 RepID=UPI00209255DF|nr:2'-5' RNA ligase family protein [Flavobacterium sp. NRK1]MCO6147369.1 2'-5' RNA ligase family protein [Flavobacterium sp. NRK1]